MAIPIKSNAGMNSSARLLSTTTSLTIGSAVCFAEGLSAALMLMAPKNHWFYIIAALLSLGSGLAFWRFRETKMGAEIGDLWLCEFAIRTIIPIIGYFTLINPDVLWYPATALSILKIIRVYIWQSSATHQYGWGTFGFMTRHYAKHYSKKSTQDSVIPYKKLMLEILIALIVAGLASMAIKTLFDYERVILMWIVPFTFEFLYGPAQLRNLKIFNDLLFASTQRETEQAAKIAELEQKLTALQSAQSDPDGVNAELNAYYYGIHPEQRPHFLGVGKKMRQLYPVEPK